MKLCVEDGCEKQQKARELCDAHYMRWLRSGGKTGDRYTSVCSIDGCENRHRARGLCGKHYMRWHSHGDPIVLPKRRRKRIPLEERFLSRFTQGDPDECWEWQGGRTALGYGRISLGGDGGYMAPAARVAHEFFKGPIPEGYQVDHLCFNPPCVNPAHLEAVTKSENLRRRRLARNDKGQFVQASPITVRP